jgi:hypothetical protein
VDIEHCYLYSLETMKRLMERHGFDLVESGAATNTLSLRHLLYLLPGPANVKRGLLAATDGTRVGRLPLRIPLGNLYAIGRRQ